MTTSVRSGIGIIQIVGLEKAVDSYNVVLNNIMPAGQDGCQSMKDNSAEGRKSRNERSRSSMPV
ncbi:hypothetical protein B7P43_G04501 [Cryptotermes secundus]|uniref:Uncharacterized protein n=1 Tax=Cryptotermes secundus TaxID=105785 RepID=A0A2J7QW23_9NEOP|nr:hypothetical protein B7P43_G04501 [Cryptotermes secundus]